MYTGIHHPLATELDVAIKNDTEASLAPSPRRTVYQNEPVTVFGQVANPEKAVLTLSWKEGQQYDVPLNTSPSGSPHGETLRLLRGARLISAAEAQLATTPGTPIKRRDDKRLEKRIGELSAEYELASRFTSLVAVVKREGDKPGALPETRIVPVGMPPDTDLDAVYEPAPMQVCGVKAMALTSPRRPPQRISKLASFLMDEDMPAPVSAPICENLAENDAEDIQTRIAAMLKSDGGMPGATSEERLANSLAALACLTAGGNTTNNGPFRAHMKKLTDFLQHADWSIIPKKYAAKARAFFDRLQNEVSPDDAWRDVSIWIDHPGKVWKMLS